MKHGSPVVLKKCERDAELDKAREKTGNFFFGELTSKSRRDLPRGQGLIRAGSTFTIVYFFLGDHMKVGTHASRPDPRVRDDALSALCFKGM